jgi:hypothetical protein
VLLEPLPYGDPQDLIAVWGRFDPESGFDFPQFPLSIPEYVDYRAQSRTLEDVAAYRRGRLTVTETGQEPERVAVGVVTANLFPLLRVAPVLGRTFTHEETLPNAAQVVVLHHGYWLRRFGGDPDVVGKSVVANGVPRQVVGVMPPGFEVAIRTALGARRWRLVQLLLGESVLLSATGAALGIRLAHFGVRTLARLNAGSIPRAESLGIDAPVLAFGLAVTLVTAALFGLLPAFQTAAADVQSHLREGGRGASDWSRGGAPRDARGRARLPRCAPAAQGFRRSVPRSGPVALLTVKRAQQRSRSRPAELVTRSPPSLPVRGIMVRVERDKPHPVTVSDCHGSQPLAHAETVEPLTAIART